MRRKAHCLALAEALSLFSLSYCVAKTINFVNFCLQCPVFNASGPAVCHPQWLAGRLALAEAPILFFSVVLCWQNVKTYECLLGMPSFQCIGAGSVPPPMACRTLGRTALRKAHRLALAEVLILFFFIVLCWQNIKICECLLATPSFQCIGAGSVPPPMACRTLGRATRQMARRLALPQAPM